MTTPDQTENEMWTSVAKERADGTPPTAAPAPEQEVASQDSGEQAAATPIDPVELRIQELIASQQQFQQNQIQLTNQLREATGRIGALQSELAKSKAAPAQNAPTAAAATAALATPEKWAEIKEQYPDWAEGIEALVQANRSAAGAPEQGVDVEAIRQSVRDEMVETLRTEQLSRVEMRHPGWANTVGTPAFQQWKASQPAEVQALGASPFAEDAIRMLDLFKSGVRAQTPDELNQQRQGVLNAGTHQRPSAPARLPSAGNVQLTPEQLWAEEAKRRATARAASAA